MQLAKVEYKHLIMERDGRDKGWKYRHIMEFKIQSCTYEGIEYKTPVNSSNEKYIDMANDS